MKKLIQKTVILFFLYLSALPMQAQQGIKKPHPYVSSNGYWVVEYNKQPLMGNVILKKQGRTKKELAHLFSDEVILSTKSGFLAASLSRK